MAIARQLRLRNLGGIIILDFIDMGDAAHRRQVLQALEPRVGSGSCPRRTSSASHRSGSWR